MRLQTELGDYPESHQYFIFATEDAPSWATEALERIQESGSGQRLRCLLANISVSLTQAMTETTSRAGNSSGSKLDNNGMEFSGDESDDGMSVGGWEDDYSLSNGPDVEGDSQMTDFADLQSQRLTEKLKFDLQQAQAAGFKVGVLGDFKGGMDLYVSLGIRISKLGISNAAMNAWGLERTNYLILLIHYSHYYQDLAKLIDSCHTRRTVTMCVGTSNRYKPTPFEAMRAFSKTTQIGSSQQVAQNKNDDPEGGAACGEGEEASSFKGVFISRPLNELLNLRLVEVLKHRLEFALGWDGAEMLFGGK
jgi:ubiquitin-conjugating enzyme E2 Q